MNDRKKKQVERYLKAQKHHRSLDERKLIKENSKRRREEREPRRRERRGWSGSDDEGDGTFEKIRRARRLDLGAASGATPARAEQLAAADKLVVSLAPGRAAVLFEGQTVVAELAPALARVQQSAVAVGDLVALEERAGAAPRVVGVAPRRSSLVRPDPGRPERERVLAANVDVGIIVVPVGARLPRLRLVDRIAVALERGGVRPRLCVNKVDLLDGPARARLAASLEGYAFVEPILTSALTGEGIAALAEALEGATAVFVGHSGAGKSSLLNALDPAGERETSQVRGDDGRGRHTTTSSSLSWLPGGARVIDTPGIRSFGVRDMSPGELAAWFPGLAERARGCRFRDCLHVTEPECAVRADAASDAGFGARYAAYLRILAEL